MMFSTMEGKKLRNTSNIKEIEKFTMEKKRLKEKEKTV